MPVSFALYIVVTVVVQVGVPAHAARSRGEHGSNSTWECISFPEPASTYLWYPRAARTEALFLAAVCVSIRFHRMRPASVGIPKATRSRPTIYDILPTRVRRRNRGCVRITGSPYTPARRGPFRISRASQAIFRGFIVSDKYLWSCYRFHVKGVTLVRLRGREHQED